MPVDTKLTTFGELADVLQRLPWIVFDTRRARGLSQREACRQAGVNQSIFNRLERGETLHLDNLIPVLRWLDQTSAGMA